MAVRNKNVMMADGGTGYVLPAQPNLANYTKNNSAMQDAIEQAKINLGYAKPAQPSGMPSSVYNQLSASQISKYPTNTAASARTSIPTIQTSTAQSSVPKQPSGMPSSDYEKWVAMQKGENLSPTNSLGNNTTSNTSGNSNSGYSGSVGNSGSGTNALVQNYYNNNINALQSAYEQKLAGLQGNLASQQNLLKANYNLSRNALADDAERALQEAYINRTMNERSLQQQLNAQGLNGGATESAIASLLNNYGNSRNNITVAHNKNLAELENAYLANLAQAQQSYNEAVTKAASDNANYRMELENALYKAMLS
jgi:hypothetical protein